MNVTRKALQFQVDELNEAHNASGLFTLNPQQAGYSLTYKTHTLGAGVITAKEMYFYLWGMVEATNECFKLI